MSQDEAESGCSILWIYRQESVSRVLAREVEAVELIDNMEERYHQALKYAVQRNFLLTLTRTICRMNDR